MSSNKLQVPPKYYTPKAKYHCNICFEYSTVNHFSSCDIIDSEYIRKVKQAALIYRCVGMLLVKNISDAFLRTEFANLLKSYQSFRRSLFQDKIESSCNGDLSKLTGINYGIKFESTIKPKFKLILTESKLVIEGKVFVGIWTMMDEKVFKKVHILLARLACCPIFFVYEITIASPEGSEKPYELRHLSQIPSIRIYIHINRNHDLLKSHEIPKTKEIFRQDLFSRSYTTAMFIEYDLSLSLEYGFVKKSYSVIFTAYRLQYSRNEGGTKVAGAASANFFAHSACGTKNTLWACTDLPHNIVCSLGVQLGKMIVLRISAVKKKFKFNYRKLIDNQTGTSIRFGHICLHCYAYGYNEGRACAAERPTFGYSKGCPGTSFTVLFRYYDDHMLIERFKEDLQQFFQRSKIFSPRGYNFIIDLSHKKCKEASHYQMNGSYSYDAKRS
uniref:Uncharacterized protein n=1 Tax=Parascaris equorum TaxID=6256 RepID=A0A914RQQ3_PAREQ